MAGTGFTPSGRDSSHRKLLNKGYSDAVNGGIIYWNGKTNTQIKTTGGRPRLEENCNFFRNTQKRPCSSLDVDTLSMSKFSDTSQN